MDKCARCDKEAEKLQRCSICYSVSYCSQECQKADLKVHKKFCRPWLRFHPVIDKFVPCEIGKVPDCLAPWIDHSREILRGTSSPSGPQNLHQISDKDSLDLAPGGMFQLRYEPEGGVETLGDLLSVMFPDRILQCDSTLFAKLMNFKLSTPLSQFSISIEGSPCGPNIYATPAHPIVNPLLLNYFDGMGMVCMFQYRTNKVAAMLPDGPIVGTVDAVTSAMTSLFTKLNDIHPGAKTIVPGGTYHGYPDDTPAGHILADLMSKIRGLRWEIYRGRGG